MKQNWIPRYARWSVQERQARETAARNNREMKRLFWLEAQKLREQIESEISDKKLAKIAALE